MNKIIYITALFFSVLGFSQSVSGKVETEEGLSIANVLVINIKKIHPRQKTHTASQTKEGKTT